MRFSLFDIDVQLKLSYQKIIFFLQVTPVPVERNLIDANHIYFQYTSVSYLSIIAWIYNKNGLKRGYFFRDISIE